LAKGVHKAPLTGVFGRTLRAALVCVWFGGLGARFSVPSQNGEEHKLIQKQFRPGLDGFRNPDWQT